MAAAAPFTALAYTSFVGVAAASWWFGYSFKASDLAHQHEAYIKHEESQKTKYEDLQKLYKETSTKLDKIENPAKYEVKSTGYVSDGTPKSHLREKLLAPIFKL